MISPARTAAFDILLRVEREQAYASELLHSDRLNALSPADRGLCMELVMGTLRWRSRLDGYIRSYVFSPFERLDLEVLTALRLGTYQIAFLERIPAHAAINESVEMVKRSRKSSAATLTNAVLRKIANFSGKRVASPVLAANEAAQPTAVRVRMPGGSRNAGTLARFYAHPEWLVERWVEHFKLDTTERICAYDQAVPQAAIRLRDPAVEEELKAEGIELAPGVLLAGARRVIAGDVTGTRAFAERRVSIQDEASQLVALLVGRGESVLDCCAAPGGKTVMLAQRNPEAQIVAAELHPHRARLLQRMLGGQSNVRVITADAVALPLAARFDRVLADVPCSGTGTLARNPEIKWRLRPTDLAQLQKKQVAILRAALERVAPGGRLLYSSCSLEQEENEDVIEQALTPEFRLLQCADELQIMRRAGEVTWSDVPSLTRGPFLRTLPGVQPCDGFFAAILERAE